MGRPRRFPWVRVLIAGIPLLAAMAVAGAPPAGAAPRRGAPFGTPDRFGKPPEIPRGSADLGRLPANREVHVTVFLRPSQPDGLATYASDVARPGRAGFHRYLTPSEFASRFGPTTTAIGAVRAWLAGLNLKAGPVSTNGLAMSVTAPAGLVEQAFGLRLHGYRLRSGRTAYANLSAPAVPADVAPYVQAIVGLDDLHRWGPGPNGPPRAPGLPGPGGSRAGGSNTVAGRVYAPPASTSTTVNGQVYGQPRTLAGVQSSAIATSGPAACSGATTEATTYGAWTANQLAQAYEMTNLYADGLLGGQVTVGLYELEPYLASDIAAYQSCYGTSTSVTNVTVDGGPACDVHVARNQPCPGAGEAALDIEDVIGLAPQAQVLVYEAPNSGSGALDNWNAIISADQAKVVSTSWGLCEQLMTAGELQAENTLFEEAATQGQTILSAAGDSGSTDCYGSSSADTFLSVHDPASQPFVTGVGGTDLTGLGPAPTETVWNGGCSSICAGGGGISAVWGMPSWQSGPGVITSYSGQPVEGAISGEPCATSGDCREVPDVSASADPSNGYVIYYDGSWTVFGGTSPAAPLWASAIALVDNGCAAAPVGFINPRLYQAAALGPSPFNDITTGNNAILSTANGDYPATSAYDLASGLGSPVAPTLAQDLCAPMVQQVSPTGGPSAGGTPVTVTGTGFTPTTQVDFGSVPATSVTVGSPTSLTAVAPPGAGTVAIAVNTAGGISAPVSGDEFSYGLPAVTGLSTSSATPGTQVTISGSGFGSSQGSSYVTFLDSSISWGAPGNAAHLTIDSWTPSAVTFTVPTPQGRWVATIGTTATVSLTVGGVTSNPVRLAIVPSATFAINLSASSAQPGTQVTITPAGGASFGSTPGYVTFVDAGITWGGPSSAAHLTIDSWSATAITFTVPTLGGTWQPQPGTTAQVGVTTAQWALSGTVPLTVAPMGSFTVAASAGTVTPGQLVTLSGTALGSAGWVTFVDGQVAWGSPSDAAPLKIDSWTSSQIVFTVPTVSGRWTIIPGSTATVSVTNAAGDVSNTLTLTVAPTGSITISSVSTATAVAGQQVTLTGTNFGSPGWVTLVDKTMSWGAPFDAANFVVNSWTSTQIVFTVPTPSGAGFPWQVVPGTTATITVTSSAWAVSNSVSLGIGGTGTIPLLSVYPTSAAPGQTVTLTGAGFGSTQGSGYVTLVDNGASWGSPGDPAPLVIGSWSTNASGTSSVTFVVPSGATAGTNATVTVTNAADAVSNSVTVPIT